MELTERVLLEATTRAALAHASADADPVLAELGWLEMLQAEPDDAIAVVFTELGCTTTATTALDDVLAFALGLGPRTDLAVMFPFGTGDSPGHHDGNYVRATGFGTARLTTATEVVIVCNNGAGAVTVPSAPVGAEAVRGIDPDGRWFRAHVDQRAELSALAPGAWESAVALGRRAIAHQIAGATRAMLDAARTHALERVQFDRPIARFQAVRHRLAETLVAIEALEATLTAAADERSPLTAALAKVAAGRAARTAATHCQQVLAGIGFTTEHPFHRYLKRTMLLDGLLGSADDITVDIGRQLLAERRVPTLIEL